jgi:hypothetical protein
MSHSSPEPVEPVALPTASPADTERLIWDAGDITVEPPEDDS